MHSDQGWPRKLRDSLGLVDGQFIDASCWGAILDRGPGTTLADQVRYAEGLGEPGGSVPVVQDPVPLHDHRTLVSLPGLVVPYLKRQLNIFGAREFLPQEHSAPT